MGNVGYIPPTEKELKIVHGREITLEITDTLRKYSIQLGSKFTAVNSCCSMSLILGGYF